MTTYGGYELLEIAPNSVTGWGTSLARATETAENPQGNVIVRTSTAIAHGTRALEWICATRAELVALEAVLTARKGQLEPLWIPTYQTDVERIDAGSDSAWFMRIGLMPPTLPTVGEKWRHWIARSRSSADYLVRYFDLVTDLGGGVYRWSTSPGAGPLGIGAASIYISSLAAVFSRLVLSRMASDTYHVRYAGRVAVVSAEFVEIDR